MHSGVTKITDEARRHLITLIEDVCRMKNYMEETLFLACSLVDRYLVHIVLAKQATPCLIRLAIIATLIAAKLEQPIQPSYIKMVKLIAHEWKVDIDVQELYDLEQSIIFVLDFDLRYEGPIFFLGRFLRIYGLDQVRQDKDSFLVDYLARKFCRLLLRSREYLMLRPS